ncbi:MAG TPA: GtrA family protein [Terriglobales bacterium]|jgi:putative flippase GtrA|nr:GtrA family protein [Terriglobales bacterium]
MKPPLQSNQPNPASGLFIRWIKFNAVGMLGVGVQLAMLTSLTNTVGVHYLPATALAVETAVLHNFLWHERYTWRDLTQSAQGAGGLHRLLRFHLTNGLLSLTGNVLLMRLLAGVLHLPLMAANILCIVTCSLANFAMSHSLVFRARPAL